MIIMVKFTHFAHLDDGILQYNDRMQNGHWIIWSLPQFFGHSCTCTTLYTVLHVCQAFLYMFTMYMYNAYSMYNASCIGQITKMYNERLSRPITCK